MDEKKDISSINFQIDMNTHMMVGKMKKGKKDSDTYENNLRIDTFLNDIFH